VGVVRELQKEAMKEKMSQLIQKDINKIRKQIIQKEQYATVNPWSKKSKISYDSS
jgi:hypothetical protein